MSRNPWLDRLLHSTRNANSRNASELSIRHLERRRVLDATLPAILVSPTPTAEGDTVTVSADAGEIASPQFDWTISVDDVVVATSNSALFEFTPPDDASYTIDLVVTDASEEQCAASRTITVNNVAPELTIVGDQTAQEGAPLVIENLGQISDPGFADATLGTAETFTYRINWGDGHIDSGNATIDQLGGPGTPTLASFDAQHIYADNGTYNVSVIVLDDNGGRDTGSFKVTVGNVDPTLTVVGNQTVVEGDLLEIENLGQVSDPGFVNVALGNQETFAYTINWGDGTTPDAGSATIDRVGFENNPTLASFDGQHTYTADGTYEVSVTVVDDDGGMATSKFTVNVLSAAPTLNVAGNQTVEEGSQLSIEDIGSVSIPLYGEGDQVEYSIDWGDGSAPDVGVVTIDQLGAPTLASFDGQHTYADDGTYSVTITIDDGEGGSDTGTLDVTVGNVAPTLTLVEDQAVVEGSLLEIENLGQISDPGYRNTLLATDEIFTYSIDWGDGTTADTGVATIDQLGSPGTPTLASFDGQHTYADNGEYTVTVSVADDDGGQTMQTLQVTVGNVAPVLTVVENQSIKEGSLLSIENIGQITDPGYQNDALAADETFTYSIDWGDGTSTDTGAATIDQLGSPGTPTLASFDGQHTYADNGEYTVTVSIADDDGGHTMQTLQVTVGNVAPVLTVVEDQSIEEGSLLSIENIGQITDPGYKNDALATNETFTYSIDWGDGTATDTGAATIDQLGSPGTPTLASFDGQHTYADNGTYTVTVTVVDDDLGETTATFEVSVGNVAPALTVVENQSIDEGAPLVIGNLGQITDPAFGSVKEFTYSIDWGDGTTADTGTATIDQLGSPGTPTLASFDGQHTYADNGEYTVTVSIADDDGGVAEQTFEVTVNNVAPTLTVVENQSIDEGSLLSIENIGQITDPGYDNDAIPTDETFSYVIDWGDGTTTDTGAATIDQVGSEGVPTLASLDGQHTYADNGTYTVTVSIADDDGGQAMQTFEVTVGNVAPTLTVVENQSIDEGSLLSIENIGQITDPGYKNDALASDETFSYSIDWGDGTATDSGAATIDQVGSEGVPTLASLDGQHTYADNGTYTVTVSIADDDGGQAMQTFEVTVGNVAPMLTVADNQSIDEGSLLSIENIGQITDPGYNNDALSTDETFSYVVDWGDGTATDTGAATVDQVGSEGVLTLASLDGQHTYADNGVYTVTVTAMDDDGGVAEQTFLVNVSNVAPQLTGVDTPHVLDEGEIFDLGSLGVGISDPGFDNFGQGDPETSTPLSTETFTATTIDWGDGALTSPVDMVDRLSGSPGELTTAGFDHAPHAYADNGTYTVTVEFADDDGAMVSQSFTITVNNVAPTLTLTDESFAINEGDTLTIPMLGSFTDPGFNNPNRPGGASTETFHYEISWGDGTPVETGVLPTSVTDGGQGELTMGSLSDSHLYADNDADNTYTITVKLLDDDGGFDVQSFDVTVWNVAPTLHPIAAIDVTSGGNTILTLNFTDPGADTFEVLVAWGENQEVPVEDRWVIEAYHDGPTPQSFVLYHQYDGPPNPDNITADIPISVVIRDDDFSMSTTLAIGQSNIETVLVGQPGTEAAKFAIDTTPDIPAIEFPQLNETPQVVETASSYVSLTQTNNIESGGGEVSATTERFFRLHVVLPDGRMLEGIRLPDGVMDDLPALFARLPDNHYRIFFVRSDSQSERLVLDVVLRDHRPTDPADASDGTRDRPPTEDLQQPAEQQQPPGEANEDIPQTPAPQAPAAGNAAPADMAPADALDEQTSAPPAIDTQNTSSTARRAAAASALAAAAVVLDPKTDWAVRLDRAFARADRRHWQRLRRRRPR
ncbi:PKD domain-containing protein [Aeoliella sp. ICT_H6.2]|uniref:PKD domain-containing protein n=1 Tax=Aeoliella straminimaris TaxID=2954799 RepID=A0A9X2JI53_9BACT|nr:PKD domain-containing protein [Aeoliella straminimaris]MCO6046167.1 PKD domain-containing protein [Aeoliella straminimaris]